MAVVFSRRLFLEPIPEHLHLYRELPVANMCVGHIIRRDSGILIDLVGHRFGRRPRLHLALSIRDSRKTEGTRQQQFDESARENQCAGSEATAADDISNGTEEESGVCSPARSKRATQDKFPWENLGRPPEILELMDFMANGVIKDTYVMGE